MTMWRSPSSYASVDVRGRRRRSSQAGFSLVEVLASVGLLAVGLIPIAYVGSSGTRDGVSSYGVVVASALAVELQDKLVNLLYYDSRLRATDGFVSPSTTLSNTNPLTANGTTWTSCTSGSCGFTRTWQITDNSPRPYTKTVDIQVSWKEFGRQRTFTLSTIKAVN